MTLLQTLNFCFAYQIGHILLDVPVLVSNVSSYSDSIAGSQPAPEEFDNEVMDMLKHHAENEGRELRTGWPDLK